MTNIEIEFAGDPTNAKDVATWINLRMHPDLSSRAGSLKTGAQAYDEYEKLIKEALSKRADFGRYDEKVLLALLPHGAFGGSEVQAKSFQNHDKVYLGDHRVVAEITPLTLSGDDGSDSPHKIFPDELEAGLKEIFEKISEAMAITENIKNNYGYILDKINDDAAFVKTGKFVRAVEEVKALTFWGDATNVHLAASWIDQQIDKYIDDCYNADSEPINYGITNTYEKFIKHILQQRADYAYYDLSVLQEQQKEGSFSREEFLLMNPNEPYSWEPWEREEDGNYLQPYKLLLAGEHSADIIQYYNGEGFPLGFTYDFFSEKGLKELFKQIPRAIAVTNILKKQFPGALEKYAAGTMHIADFRRTLKEASAFLPAEIDEKGPKPPKGRVPSTHGEEFSKK